MHESFTVEKGPSSGKALQFTAEGRALRSAVIDCTLNIAFAVGESTDPHPRSRLAGESPTDHETGPMQKKTSLGSDKVCVRLLWARRWRLSALLSTGLRSTSPRSDPRVNWDPQLEEK